MFYIWPGAPAPGHLLFLLLWQLAASAEVAVKELSRGDAPTLPPPYLHLPVFVDSRLPLVEMQQFSPARGTGQEPLPESFRELLRPAPRPTTRPLPADGGTVRTFCQQHKMHVQVLRSLLGAGETPSQLRLGTCQASETTRDHFYFEYDVGMCGTKRAIVNNQVTYSNTLQYKPPRPRGLIRRTVPFTLPVACYYNRYQYSYKIGYTPEVRMRKIFKAMRNQAKFILTPRNAQWERFSPSGEYVLGEPMYFEAAAPSLSRDERLYVQSCYATPYKSHTAKPQFPVVINFGCMLESKDGRSRFIPYKNNTVRFTVDAFLFRGMTGQELYMHCAMSVGSSVPSATAKSCNYDANSGRWVELYGSDSVCTCCDSNCSSVGSTATKIISSRAWTLESKGKPTKTARWQVASTTATSAARQLGTPREVQRWPVPPHPGARAETRVGKVEKESERSLRNGRGKWDRVEDDERQVKGSAVVEEALVTHPRRIFEEIFVFDE